MAVRRSRVRTLLVVVLGLALVAGLVAVGTLVWQRANRTPLEDALRAVPKSSLRVGFTDWALVRRQLDENLGDDPDRKAVEGLVDKAYDSDFGAVSSIDESAVALQEKFGFSPATAQWEAFAQGREGATMVLKVADGADFDVLGDNLRTLGYDAPDEDDGVWSGGVDLVAGIDGTLSPELQYVALLEDEGLVVSSDNGGYAETAAKVAAGDAGSFASVEGVTDMGDRLGEPANAMFWGGDFACEDLAMSQADEEDQAQADDLVADAGGVTPLDGLAMGMQPDRTLRVVAHFEDADGAEENLRPRARLAVGEAVGRGGSFADDFELDASRARGNDVLLDLRPKEGTGYVLSAVYDGPVLFATC